MSKELGILFSWEGFTKLELKVFIERFDDVTNIHWAEPLNQAFNKKHASINVFFFSAYILTIIQITTCVYLFLVKCICNVSAQKQFIMRLLHYVVKWLGLLFFI